MVWRRLVTSGRHSPNDKTAGYAGLGPLAALARTRRTRVCLCVADEVSASNVMVDADFSAAQAAELLFRPMRARAVKRIRFLVFGVLDPFEFETLMQVVP
jgi:hypothetical protein